MNFTVKMTRLNGLFCLINSPADEVMFWQFCLKNDQKY